MLTRKRWQETRPRAALYARVSTVNHAQDPGAQLRELRVHARRRGWRVVDEFVDRGVSGARKNRPELDRLMKAAAGKAFDVVLVWKLDRFGRSVQHLSNALGRLQKKKVSFVSLTDGFDTTTHNGTLMFHILSAVAEFELAIIKERIRAGLANAKAKGKRWGGAHIPRTKLLDLREARQLLKAKGASLRSVAKTLGISHTLLWNRLHE